MRRAPGTAVTDYAVFERRTGQWTYLGGGGGGYPGDLTAANLLGDRRPATDLGAVMANSGSGGVATDAARWRPAAQRWISYCDLVVAAEVSSVDIDGPLRRVPRHGRLLVVWASWKPRRRARALDTDGQVLAEIALTDRRSMLSSYRARRVGVSSTGPSSPSSANVMARPGLDPGET